MSVKKLVRVDLSSGKHAKILQVIALFSKTSFLSSYTVAFFLYHFLIVLFLEIISFPYRLLLIVSLVLIILVTAALTSEISSIAQRPEPFIKVMSAVNLVHPTATTIWTICGDAIESKKASEVFVTTRTPHLSLRSRQSVMRELGKEPYSDSPLGNNDFSDVVSSCIAYSVASDDDWEHDGLSFYYPLNSNDVVEAYVVEGRSAVVDDGNDETEKVPKSDDGYKITEEPFVGKNYLYKFELIDIYREVVADDQVNAIFRMTKSPEKLKKNPLPDGEYAAEVVKIL